MVPRWLSARYTSQVCHIIGEISELQMLRHTVGMETFLWVNLLSFVRPRGTSCNKVRPKGCERTQGSLVLSCNFHWVELVLNERWRKKKRGEKIPENKENMLQLGTERTNRLSGGKKEQPQMPEQFILTVKLCSDYEAVAVKQAALNTDNYWMFCSWYPHFLWAVVTPVVKKILLIPLSRKHWYP